MTDADYASAALRITHSATPEIEFDDEPVVSKGDDPGAYVQCWIWVSDDDAKYWKENTDD